MGRWGWRVYTSRALMGQRRPSGPFRRILGSFQENLRRPRTAGKTWRLPQRPYFPACLAASPFPPVLPVMTRARLKVPATLHPFCPHFPSCPARRLHFRPRSSLSAYTSRRAPLSAPVAARGSGEERPGPAGAVGDPGRADDLRGRPGRNAAIHRGLPRPAVSTGGLRRPGRTPPRAAEPRRGPHRVTEPRRDPLRSPVLPRPHSEPGCGLAEPRFSSLPPPPPPGRPPAPHRAATRRPRTGTDPHLGPNGAPKPDPNSEPPELQLRAQRGPV